MGVRSAESSIQYRVSSVRWVGGSGIWDPVSERVGVYRRRTHTFRCSCSSGHVEIMSLRRDVVVDLGPMTAGHP